MTYVVTDNCIKCKFIDCVKVCPVDYFYAGENMLVISPDECIDFGVCEPECPADTIFPDTDPKATGEWLELNKTYADIWLNLTHKDPPPADAAAWNGVEGMRASFSPNPHVSEPRRVA